VWCIAIRKGLLTPLNLQVRKQQKDNLRVANVDQKCS
jgi:hypothetical protein